MGKYAINLYFSIYVCIVYGGTPVRKSTVTILLAVLIISVICLLVYAAYDHGRTDATPPVIQMPPEELSISVNDRQELLLADVTAHDDTDGDLTDAVFIESVYGITDDYRATVTYVVCDRAGNVTKAERSVHFTDYHSPRFTLNRALVYEYGSIFDVMKNIGAVDVIDEDIPGRIKATMLSTGLSITEEGIHDVQFRVTNSMGDTVQLILPVEIYPVNRYDASLELKTYILYLSQGDRFKAEDYPQRMVAYGDEIPLTQVSIRIHGTVDTSVPGVYPVSYTASYTQNDRTSIGYSKLIVIVE